MAFHLKIQSKHIKSNSYSFDSERLYYMWPSVKIVNKEVKKLSQKKKDSNYNQISKKILVEKQDKKYYIEHNFFLNNNT